MSSTVLLLNCGSSSVKYQLIDADNEVALATGLVQKIGEPTGDIEHETNGSEFQQERPFADHVAAIEAVVAMFNEHGPSLDDVIAVGHRTVHGGETFRNTVRIDDEVVAKLRELSNLAPLHNPPGIAGIEAARKVLGDVPHVAVFDTAFFSDLPPEAYTYPIDQKIARQLEIRRYGFHGTSHSFVSKAAAEFLDKDVSSFKQIVCHLGNGASISAIDGGRPVDTSMGMTPLEGLMMGTRSGSIDPGLLAYLGRNGYSIAEVDTLLNKKSGLLGMTGSNDFRDVLAKVEAGDADAILAFDVYIHRLIQYIGAYWAVLGGLDVLTFTAGVGENNVELRARVLNRLAGLGFKLDEAANQVRSKQPRCISAPDSKVTVLVIPTNEELAMAREVLALLHN